MISQQRGQDGHGRTAPIACSLTRAGLADQAARWQRLAARALTERAETADGLRLSFRGEPGVADELHQLADVEQDCCPWATWTVSARAGHIVLAVRSAGDGVAALHGMFSGLRPAAAGR